jgi:hypothetical protein
MLSHYFVQQALIVLTQGIIYFVDAVHRNSHSTSLFERLWRTIRKKGIEFVKRHSVISTTVTRHLQLTVF